MGHRGCRLGITYPEIYLMQAKAISSAAIRARKEGIEVNVEIMIPLVGLEKSLQCYVNKSLNLWKKKFNCTMQTSNTK